MSNKIGRFEIQSEVTHSENGSVYKACDPENGQTVALKTIKLDSFGEQAAALMQRISEEAQTAKTLNSHNIAAIYGTEECEGQLCVAMEYVQGNSIATMLARKEGFSIWDLQDVARQACQGLDHAHVHEVVHYSLEPAKVMVQWDGTVKVLGFGISSMGAYAAQACGAAPEILYYMSPEQLHGDPVDARSNLFSLGAILYEMVTERKAFQGEDADQVRQTILEMTPVAPDQINRKVHPVLSEVIMKALAKDPGERYASGQDLVNDLERCKESASKAAVRKTSASQGSPGAKPAPAESKMGATQSSVQSGIKEKDSAPASAPLKSVAAAAGASRTDSAVVVEEASNGARASRSGLAAKGVAAGTAVMSTAAAAPPEKESPAFAVDPMMDESRKSTDAKGRSFSDVTELPPLQDAYIPPPPVEEPVPVLEEPVASARRPEPPKPKTPPREVAKKAVAEISNTPPRLFLYSIGAAVVIILLMMAGIAMRIRSENSDNESASTASSTQSASQESSQPAQQGAGPAGAAGAAAPGQVAAEPLPAQTGAVSVKPRYNAKKKVKAPPPSAPAIIPGQLSINSTPEGAQISLDGQNDASWVTPYNMAGVSPGQHTVVVSKPGYTSETRSIEVGSGNKSFIVVQLAQLMAAISVTSEPMGASIWMDGKDTGRVTPAQLSVDRAGAHNFVLKMQGYLDETTTANLQIGQTAHISPALKSLGRTDDIRVGGKFKKIFGGGGGAADMGTVNVRTQPKGAQIAVNNRVIDKTSPVEFYLNPGNYRVISVEKSGKVVIDESLDRE